MRWHVCINVCVYHASLLQYRLPSEKWQPPTSLVHVSGNSSCYIMIHLHILPEMPFRFHSSGLDPIVCLLHNLSAGKMWGLIIPFFFSSFCLQPRAHTWGRLSSRINVSVADSSVNCKEKKGFRQRWICILFLLSHVQTVEKKIDSGVLCRTTGLERLWKQIVSTSQTTATSAIICYLCRDYMYLCIGQMAEWIDFMFLNAYMQYY